MRKEIVRIRSVAASFRVSNADLDRKSLRAFSRCSFNEEDKVYLLDIAQSVQRASNF